MAQMSEVSPVIDYLVCGACNQGFSLANMVMFMQHKKFDCDDQELASGLSRILLCQSCPEQFCTPWRLLQHAQSVHSLKIYLENCDLGWSGQITSTPSARTAGHTQYVRIPATSGTEHVSLSPSTAPGQTQHVSLSPTTAPRQTQHVSLSPSTTPSQTQDVSLSPSTTPGQTQLVSRSPSTTPGQTQHVSLSPSTAPGQTQHVSLTLSPTNPHCMSVTRDQQYNQVTKSRDHNAASEISQTPMTSSTLRDFPEINDEPIDMTESGESSVEQVSVHVGGCPAQNADDRVSRDIVLLSDVISRDTANTATLAQRTASVGPNVTHKPDHISSEPEAQLVGGRHLQSSLSSDGKPLEQKETVEEMTTSEVDGRLTQTCESDPKTSNEREPTVEDVEATETQSVAKDDNCCGSQDCGVTVLPGSHEELKKCCSAVVPKKRKQHMETKHMSVLAAARARRKAALDKHRFKPTSIVIDLEHMTDDLAEDEISSHSASIQPSPDRTVNEPVGLQSMCEENVDNPQRTNTKHAKIPGYINTSSVPIQRSVIIQPGSTFSIPVSYSVGGSSMVSVTRSPSGKSTKNSHSASSNRFTSMLCGLKMSATQYDRVGSAGVRASDGIAQAKTHTDGRSTVSVTPLSSQRTDAAGCSTDRQARYFRYDYKPGGKKRRYPTSRPFKCDQCDDAFNQRIHLKKHLSKHTGIKPFKCEQCDYSTVERSHLKVHIRVHTGEKPFKCTYCEYATAQNSTLKIHLKRHHGKDGVFICSTCRKHFPQETLLTNHTREHVQNQLNDQLTSHSNSQHSNEHQTLSEQNRDVSNEPAVPSDPGDTQSR